MENFVSILEWILPAGGLGAFLTWLTNKTLRNIRTTKEVHDAYKQMYDDVKRTLIDILDENNKLRKAVSKLERAISKAGSCRYADSCPVLRDDQLRETEIVGNDEQYGEQGQPEDRRNKRGKHIPGTGFEGKA
jgi:hypothetical protein